MLESSLTASVRLSDEQQAELNRHKRAVRINNEKYFRCHPVRPRGQERPPLAPPERISCASSGRAWQARASNEEGLATGHPATASGARASRLHSRRSGCCV